MIMDTCAVCKKHKNTRPFGVDGAPICFACMKSDPALEQEARLQLMKIAKHFIRTGEGPDFIIAALAFKDDFK